MPSHAPHTPAVAGRGARHPRAHRWKPPPPPLPAPGVINRRALCLLPAVQDGCLVHTKSGASFAVTADDWRWFNDQVPKKLAQWASEGYQLVIFR